MRILHHSAFWLAGSLTAGMLLAMAVGVLAGETPGRGATASSFKAFSESATPSDRLPAVGRRLQSAGKPASVGEALFEGAWNVGMSRRLVDAPGISLYGVPTSKGQVCFVVAVAGRGAGGCVADFTSQLPIGISVYDPDEVDSGHPVVVSGLVPNDVTAVEVEVNQQVRAARLARNGFLYSLSRSDGYPSAVVAHYEGGAVKRIAIPDPRATMRKLGS